MSNYKESILDLNYCLYSNLCKTLIFRDDCTIALNPDNDQHQQSNVCFRIRLQRKQDLEKLLNETKPLFDRVSVVPRYFIDELCGVSLDEVQEELARLNIKADVDTDFIMSWSGEKENVSSVANDKGICIEVAPLDDLEELVQLFAAAYKYGDNADWLYRKLGDQLKNQDVYTIYKGTVSGDIVSAVILNTPPGLPAIGHINSVATHPKHQGKGYAEDVLKYALKSKGGSFYLEVYDDLYHAHRLYEKVGFQKEGTLKTISFGVMI